MDNLATPNLSNTGAASALIGDPAKFGRVGEDGTVYVITPEGDRAVGSYPGKTPEEALAYFVKKFEMAASEVALLAARIRSGAMVPSDAHEAVNKLRTQISGLNGVGDLANLAASLEKIPALITEHEGAYQAKKAAQNAEREARKVEAAAIKEKIVAEAESLVESVAWKVTTARLKVLLDEWKKAPRLDKKVDAALWKRFSSSRNKFDKRRRTHFANLDSEQKKVAATKETIVKEAESLANSKDWLNTAKQFKSLMDQWKADPTTFEQPATMTYVETRGKTRESNSDDPAVFYLVSYPAHAAHPTTKATRADANRVELGSKDECNERTIFQYIHENGIKSCQLVLGFTEFDAVHGSRQDATRIACTFTARMSTSLSIRFLPKCFSHSQSAPSIRSQVSRKVASAAL